MDNNSKPQLEPNTSPTPSPQSSRRTEGGSLGEPAIEINLDCSHPSAVPDGVVISDFSSGSICCDEDRIPGPREVTVAVSRVQRSCFDSCLLNNVVTIMASDELADAGDDPSPPGGEGGVKVVGPHTTILRSFFRKGLSCRLSGLATKYGIKPPYMLVKPGAEATVTTPAPGCTAVYVASLEMGLRFPLHPFILELLNCYGLAICNVSPNSWDSVLCFLTIRDMMEVSPTLRLWRNLFRLGPVAAKPNGYGWWSFSVRKGYKVISGLVSNQHTFWGEFVYVYNQEPDTWNFALVPTLVEPDLHMNHQVDQMDDIEASVALYLRSRMIIEPCGTVSVLPMYWVPGREELKHEEFMCVVGLNHRYSKELTRCEDPMASHITKAQLLRAQLQAKIALGVFKAPPPPADHKKAPRRVQAPAKKAPSVVHVEEPDHEGDDHMVEDDAAPLQVDGAESAFAGEGRDSSPASKKRKAHDGQPWGSDDPPFMVISEKYRFKRLTKSMNVLFTPADNEYFEGIPHDEELDGFHMAWAEVIFLEYLSTLLIFALDVDPLVLIVQLSIHAAAMARRKHHLRRMEIELDGLRKQKEELSVKVSHLEAENQRMESDLEVAEEKSAKLKSAHDKMKAKYMTCKASYAKKKEQVQELKEELLAAEAESKEPKDGLAYIEAWKKSEAGVAYSASVGQQSFTVGEESALDKMRELFARRLPSADFAAFEEDYRAMKLAEEEALMSDMLREEQERLAKEDEAGAATESVTAEAGGPTTEPSSRVVSSQGPSTLVSRDGPRRTRGDREALYHVLKPGALPTATSSSVSE
ncbi:hypothetical protein SOVF_007610 [Spinacia oleracea]|nr:hypothetical protein SOVF_007610 [Spinacia oleracea]